MTSRAIKVGYLKTDRERNREVQQRALDALLHDGSDIAGSANLPRA